MEDCADMVQYSNTFSISQVVYRDSSPVDEFYKESTKAPDDDIESYSYVDPIIMLFNQERLQSLGEMGVKAFLDSLQQSESSLSELRKKCSDEDLAKMLKSRYLQTPSEITAWCRYMDSNVDAFNQEMQQLLAEQKQSAGSTDVEPTKNSE